MSTTFTQPDYAAYLGRSIWLQPAAKLEPVGDQEQLCTSLVHKYCKTAVSRRATSKNEN
jgi:hypothetical protein